MHMQQPALLLYACGWLLDSLSHLDLSRWRRKVLMRRTSLQLMPVTAMRHSGQRPGRSRAHSAIRKGA